MARGKKPAAPKGSTALVTTVKAGTELLVKGREALALALPPGTDVDRFSMVAATSLQTTPDLLECTRESFYFAVLRCAQLNLEPMFGQAYIIARWNRRFEGPDFKEAQLMLGYQGLVQLHLRADAYRAIDAQVVYEGELFKYSRELGGDVLSHQPGPPGGMEDVVAAYARCQMKDGGEPIFDVMWRKEIDLVRAKAQSQDIWGDPQSFPEMCKKTVIRRMSKMLTKSTEVQQQLAHDDAVGYGTVEEIEAQVISIEAPDLDDQPAAATTPVDANAALRDQLEKTKERFSGERGGATPYDPDKAKGCPHAVADIVGGDSVCAHCGTVLEEDEPPEVGEGEPPTGNDGEPTPTGEEGDQGDLSF